MGSMMVCGKIGTIFWKRVLKWCKMRTSNTTTYNWHRKLAPSPKIVFPLLVRGLPLSVGPWDALARYPCRHRSLRNQHLACPWDALARYPCRHRSLRNQHLARHLSPVSGSTLHDARVAYPLGHLDAPHRCLHVKGSVVDSVT